jgi:hypothetical protein
MGGLEPSSNQAGSGEQFKRWEKYISPGRTNIPPLFGEYFSDESDFSTPTPVIDNREKKSSGEWDLDCES